MIFGSLASGGDTDIGIGISIGVGFLLSQDWFSILNMDFGSFCLYGLFWEFYTGVFCLRAFLLQFPPFISKFCLPTLLPFSLSSPFSFHGLMECAFCFLVMFFSYFLVLLEEFLCGEITVSCLLVVNNRDSGYLVQQLFFIFLRGFMILSGSVLDSLSLLSCKNSVLL